MKCTTINVNDASIENYGRADFNGIDRSNPPASINPLCEILSKYHKESIDSFIQRVDKREMWYTKNGYTVTKIRVIYYDNDGLNWSRGDMSEAVIYFKKTD